MAETELGSYCQTLPPDAESEKCWQVGGVMLWRLASSLLLHGCWCYVATRRAGILCGSKAEAATHPGLPRDAAKYLSPLCRCAPQAYSFLEGKVEAASDSAGEGEAELEKLNDMAHQLLSMGSVSCCHSALIGWSRNSACCGRCAYGWAGGGGTVSLLIPGHRSS